MVSLVSETVHERSVDPTLSSFEDVNWASSRKYSCTGENQPDSSIVVAPPMGASPRLSGGEAALYRNVTVNTTWVGNIDSHHGG